MVTSEYAMARRGDLSSFLVHLTRQYFNRSPKRNLISILEGNRIEARNYCCLFQKELERLDAGDTEAFRVACFTETPLANINYLTLKMTGRSKQLKPYGLVFRKATVAKAGGSPAIYLSTCSNAGKERQAAFWKCYRTARMKGFSKHEYSSFLPLVNKVAEDHDFSFEREWRIVGDFQFRHSEIFLALAPKSSFKELEGQFPKLPWVSPRWSSDQIIEKLRDHYAVSRKRN